MPTFFQQKAYDVLHIKNFRFYFFARFFATTGIFMQATVVSWQVAVLTHDPLSLGLIGLAEVIPFVLFALYGGHIADIYDRKTLIIVADSLYFICCVMLFLLSTFLHQFIDLWGLIPIYAVIVITGFARGFLAPAQMALLSQIVPRNLYANSATWNSVAFHVAMVGGPAIGGLICGFYSIPIAYSVVMVLIAIGLLFYLGISKQPMPKVETKENLFQSLTVGLRFVFNNQIMLGSMALDMFAVLFGGAVALLPMFAEKIGVGAQGYGLLRAAPAVGSVIMSFVLSHYPPLRNSGKKFMIAMAGFGMCMIFFALSGNFYLSFILLVLSGAFDNVSVITRTTIVQLFTPDHMRGRVASVNSIFISSSNELGAFESGVAARLLGLVPSVVFGGFMNIGVVIVTAFKAPQLRKLHLGDEMKKDGDS